MTSNRVPAIHDADRRLGLGPRSEFPDGLRDHPALRHKSGDGVSRSTSHGSDALIVVSHLTKIFRPLQLRLRSFPPVRRQPSVCALREVELTVRRGEVLGLLGTNGAGKTTLLKILATLILPTAGRVTVEGHDVTRETNRVKAMIGLATSDERSFYWRLTGRQNLEFFAAFQGLSSRAARVRIEQLRHQLGLEALDRHFGVYSTGMRHRLAIARALLRQPQILLLDEPTRSLDPLAAAVLRRLIRDKLVAQIGCTVMLATHNLEEAEELCDRIAVLHEGRVVTCGTIEELRQRTGRRTATLAGVFAHLTTGSDLP
ncbi:MAG: ABC transporter ATP-binding protein [Candidatus Methylomirabilia bacterium]